MCTAVSFKSKDHYFVRNLDLENHYNEEVVITPRNFPAFSNQKYAMIGIATVIDDYPLYYDATNECGLSMAGLNFPGNAIYRQPVDGKENIAPYELIPQLLGRCKNVSEARKFLDNCNLMDESFSADLPLTPLHWMISDRIETIVAEPAEDGLKIYDNPVGVLTNNPPFPYHMHHLCDYIGLSREMPECKFSHKLRLEPYSNGMGAMGLPGDLSSASRFVRAAFVKENSVCHEDELSSITQFFHILGAVEQQRGCVKVNDAFEITYYSSCCNTNTGVYYYKTYENSQISAVVMHNTDLAGRILIRYPLIARQKVHYQN